VTNELYECYRILDVEPGASPEELKHAYRLQAKVWHPDNFIRDPKLQNKAQERMKKINLAYERLRGATAGSYPQQASSSNSSPQPERQAAGAEYSNGKSGDQSHSQQPPPRQQRRPPPKSNSSPRTTAQSSQKRSGSFPIFNWGWKIVLAGIVCAPFAFLLASLDLSNHRTVSSNGSAAQGQASELQPPSASAVETATVPSVINTQVIRYTSNEAVFLRELAKDFSRRYSELRANAEESSRRAAVADDVIFVELQRRSADAEAKLAELRLEFKKPAEKFREAKTEKEKILSEISERIASVERQLDVAGQDSAEVHYGNKLLQLLGSFKGNEVFSGDGKNPRSTVAKEILVHVSKSHYAKTANGYEDFSNVRSLYIVNDFAFVNLPGRDVYSWSECRKIDKLISEYLTTGGTYDAACAASIRQLREKIQNNRASQTQTRAERDAIVVAESVAHQPIDSAQLLVEKCSAAVALFKSEGIVRGDESDALVKRLDELRILQEKSSVYSYEEFVRREFLLSVQNQLFGRPASVVAAHDGDKISAHKAEFIVLYRGISDQGRLRARYFAELPTSEHTITLAENYSWDGELEAADQSEAIAAGAIKVILLMSNPLP
jgi:DnaJ domain